MRTGFDGVFKIEHNETKRRIYALNGLPPEVVAVAFAKCSRSPEPFDHIAAELTQEKSSEFHEKWVVGYGHSSIAEHAVLSLALENVSVLATKAIEDNRLCSYTEKSTRYQVYDRTRYYCPKKIMQSQLAETYTGTANFLMDAYLELYPKMEAFLRRKYPRDAQTPEKMYEVIIKNRVLDSIRYILPVAILTNLGMTANARNIENAIIKLITHPLDEMREIGVEIKQAAMKIVPTLVKYTAYNEYLAETSKNMEKSASEKLRFTVIGPRKGAELVEYDQDADDRLVASLLYRFSKFPYSQIKEKVRQMKPEEKEAVVDEALKGMGKFDRPLRELEHVSYAFDIVIDYGAFRDIQRHRICTQTNQEFSPELGYATPDEIVEAGFREKYAGCMEKARKCYDEIAKAFPKEAQYILPLAYNKRTLFTMNLREIFHFVKLRTGKAGHSSYKKIAQQMYELIREKHPLMAKYIQAGTEG